MNFLIIVFVFLSFPLFAQGSAISSLQETKNPDGSVTFTEINYVDGAETFKIAIDNGKGYATVCKAMGYESSLGFGGIGLNTYKTSSGPKIRLNENATIAISESQNYIDKVTCFNSAEHKYIVRSDKSTHEDGSTTYRNLKLLGGDKEFDIAMENSFDYIATCKLLGHKRTNTDLSNSISATSSTAGEAKIKLSLSGQLLVFSDSQESVAAVNCQ